MRPTIDEQLQGTCRILEKVIAPSVTDPYARTLLAGLIANLRMLSDAIPAVPDFLLLDNRATAALLDQFRAMVDPELADCIALALVKDEPAATDLILLDRRNGELRELFSQALCGSGLTHELRTAARNHMSERAARAPMRYVPTNTTPQKPS